LGLKITLADIDESKLKMASKEIVEIVGDSNVLVVPTDVSKIEEVVKLRDRVYETWGEVRLRSQRAYDTLCIPYIPIYNRHYPFYHGPRCNLTCENSRFRCS
jgi:hypothetical protein